MRAGPSRAPGLTAAALLLAAACSKPPRLEELPPGTQPAVADPAVTIESAAVVGGRIVVTCSLSDAGVPVTGAAATALSPRWTLARLEPEPVSGLLAWRGMTLTGSQVMSSLPPGGPGTPTAEVIPNVQQPGADVGGTTTELGSGRFTYAYADLLPAEFVPPTGAKAGTTFRIGVFLYGATGSEKTATTFDFVPDGGVPVVHELVRDDNCRSCHGLLKMHGGRISGVKLCATCHTWLHADPDTMDPAALAPATRASFPNPLELGRLVHRIHRGRKLPTLFLASSSATWPTVPFTATPPLPYLNGRNATAPVGTKFAVIGRLGTEFVFGRIASRVENFQPAKTVAEGVGFPQDLRNCDVCHAGAPNRAAIGTTGATTGVSISRRTCSGCHPDVFFGDPNDLARTTPLPDTTHLAHTGGPQLNDTACVDCHVVARAGGPKLYAPIAEIHRPLNSRAPNASARWSRVTGEIVAVSNMKAGQMPTVRFKLSDRNGSITPIDNPTIPMDLVSPTSPVPRWMTGLSLVLSGPTSDYVTSNSVLRVSLVTRNATTGLFTIATGFNTAANPSTQEFTYTFTTALPATATGTWAIGIEGRRRPDSAAPAYDGADGFNWPYTGESVSEHLSNGVKYVDVASSGALTTDTARFRRAVVDQAKCEKCHMELSLHGANRHDVYYCVLCHAPDATDWDRRPRDTRTLTDGGVVGDAMVLLNNPIDPAATTKRWGYATLDGLEERSIHFKLLVHRIHVGEREGAASLEGIRPYVIYGMSPTAQSPPNAFFLDDIRFPGDLANCEVCHLRDTWTIESVPAGALATTANEKPNIRHAATFKADGSLNTAATASHPTTDPKVLPVTAACLSCHTNGAAVDHAADKTSGGVEQCPTCHGESGAESVRKWHSVKAIP